MIAIASARAIAPTWDALSPCCGPPGNACTPERGAATHTGLREQSRSPVASGLPTLVPPSTHPRPVRTATAAVRRPQSVVKEQGVVYTPEEISELMLDLAGLTGDVAGLRRTVDLSCGDGAFLVPLARRIARACAGRGEDVGQIRETLARSVHGFDISPDAVRDCIARLDQAVGAFGVKGVSWRVRQADTSSPAVLDVIREAYDVVVGNPPYVRIQNLGPERRAALRKQFKVCANGATDLYIAFYEIALSVLKPGGTISYITPSSFLKSAAGRVLRETLRTQTRLEVLIDFKQHQVFEDATTYVAIFCARKESPVPGSKFSYREMASGAVREVALTRQDELGDGPWNLVAYADRNVLARMSNGRVLLGDIAKIHCGIATLADRYYIHRTSDRDADTSEITAPDGARYRVERALLRPIVKASTLKAPLSQDLWLLFPYEARGGKNVIISEERLRDEFPLAYNYLRAIRPVLDRRDKGRPNPVAWYAFGRSQGLDNSFGRKILTSPMNAKPNFLVWNDSAYTYYGGYGIHYNGNLDRLAGLLNSPEMETFIRLTSKDFRQGYKSYAKGFIKNFPLDPRLLEGG
jgi:adenine-specific DNA-methyltransferase